MNKTAIGWTDYSANPLKYRDAEGRVRWECAKVSAGCTNCYSEALAKRWNRGADYNAAEVAKLTTFMDMKEIHSMLTLKSASGKRCFVGDMTDIFGGWVGDSLLHGLWQTFATRQDVTFQVLTKRAHRMLSFCDDVPLTANVWTGVSCENREQLRRLDALRPVRSALRFVSFEPLLENLGTVDLNGIQWAIVGGESGPRYRGCDVSSITELVEQCRAQNVPVFVKQDAHRLPGQQGRIPDSHYVQEFPA